MVTYRAVNIYGKLKAQIQAFLNPVPDSLYLYPIPNEEDR